MAKSKQKALKTSAYRKRDYQAFAYIMPWIIGFLVLKLYLFVKKSNAEGTDFYYLGKVKPCDAVETTSANDNGKLLPIVNFKMELEYAVRNDIYDYLIN